MSFVCQPIFSTIVILPPTILLLILLNLYNCISSFTTFRATDVYKVADNMQIMKGLNNTLKY